MFVLLRPVGLACQLRCGYCYYKAGHRQLNSIPTKKMEIEMIDRVLDGLRKLPERHHVICLHGGEPLLVGKEWFRDFIKHVRRFNGNGMDPKVSIAIQTNGLDVEEDWIGLFKRGSVGVSVSLDGPQYVHDAGRRFRGGNGTFAGVIDSIRRLRDAGLEPSAIAVVTKVTTSLHAEEYYRFFAEEGLKEIDIAPYVETGSSAIEEERRTLYEAGYEDLLAFVTSLFDVWLNCSDSSHFVNIRSFEQTVGALLGYIPTLCNRKGGLACGRTPCVMPDGTVFACDLETEEIDLRFGSVATEPFEEIVSSDRLRPLHTLMRQAFRKLGCTSCPLLGLCAFACPRFAFAKRDLSSYCRFSEQFVCHAKNRLNGVARLLGGEDIAFPIRAAIPSW